MSISASLANALTGLTAASRAAQLVSSNVSNAMTEGYAKRELELSAQITGGNGAGVQIDGVRRMVDETLLRDRRLADASLSQANTRTEFYDDVLAAVGEPGSPGSLTDRVAGFEAALVQAASRPDSDTRLAAVLDAAQSLASGLNDLSDKVQLLRQDADAKIATEVHRLNSALGQISDVNAQIQRGKASGQDFPGLLDKRQSLIDEIATIVPLRQIARENGTIALYTSNGAQLLDPKPSVFGFTRTTSIVAEMTVESGALSGLTLNGDVVRTDGTTAAIAGGGLASLFAIRDDDAISIQASVDEFAANLVRRFEAPALDFTRSIGDPGIFTDNGAVLDATAVTGLAGRLNVNRAVIPSEGGALWRLRDGLGASAPGASGNPDLLIAMTDALTQNQMPASAVLGGAAKGISALAADLTSWLGQSVIESERATTFEEARRNSLRNAELSRGVDTDDEMQKLILIEQAYAANAKVVQTIDRLMQSILEI